MDGTELTTRLARPGELMDIEAMYAAAVELMAGSPEDVAWEMGSHPSRRQLQEAIAHGKLLVATRPAPAGGEELCGALILDELAAQGYDAVPWSIRVPPGQAAIIHLFVVAPAARGCGVARPLLAAAAQLARERGCKTLRLDVFPNATHAIEVYKACGYTDLGLHEIRYSTCANTTFRLLDLVL